MLSGVSSTRLRFVGIWLSWLAARARTSDGSSRSRAPLVGFGLVGAMLTIAAVVLPGVGAFGAGMQALRGAGVSVQMHAGTGEGMGGGATATPARSSAANVDST